MTTQAQTEVALKAVKFCLANGTQPFRADLEILCDALTAPAAVGDNWIAKDLGIKHIKVDTIERCAQELDRLMMRAAAAAVRALKDKP